MESKIKIFDENVYYFIKNKNKKNHERIKRIFSRKY